MCAMQMENWQDRLKALRDNGLLSEEQAGQVIMAVIVGKAATEEQLTAMLSLQDDLAASAMKALLPSETGVKAPACLPAHVAD